MGSLVWTDSYNMMFKAKRVCPQQDKETIYLPWPSQHLSLKVCVCVYICAYMVIYVCMFVSVYLFVYMCMFVHLCILICVYTCVYVCVCVHACVMLGMFLPQRVDIEYLYLSLSVLYSLFTPFLSFPPDESRARLAAGCYGAMIGLAVCTTFDYSYRNIRLHKKVHTLNRYF